MEPELVERLAQHCENCEHCIHTLQQLPLEDALVETMRSGATATRSPLPEQLQGLISRLTSLYAHGDVCNSKLSNSPSQFSQEHYDFLSPPQTPDELGRLGTYRVLKILGAGGMGVVFLAEEPELQRPVALKVMKPALAASSSARRRFLREAQAMAAVQHDHVVHINCIDQAGDIPFLAMPYLQGETLEDRLQREERLALPEVVRIGREIAEGLTAAHERGLIHRDVKPPNIWLEGPRGRVKILDFGLVRAAADESHLTQPGAIAGTPAYMAPEQACGGSIDHRADLFGLGCILYRLSTGKVPFQGNGSLQILRSIEQDQPPPPEQLRSDVPPRLSSLIMRLLAKAPDHRPRSAEEVVQALREMEEEASTTALAAAPGPEAATVPVASGARMRLGLFVMLLFLAASSFAYYFGATVIHFVTDKGELVIETDAEDIEVTIRGDRAIVHDQAKNRRFVLTAGKYDVEVREEGDGGIRLVTKKFTILRGGKETFHARLEPLPKKGAPPPPRRNSTPEELDRRLTDHLFALGVRSVEISVDQRTSVVVRNLSELPKEPFRVRIFDSWGIAALNDQTVEPILKWIERRNIEYISFHGSPITDQTVRQLVKLPSIKKLYLGATEITAACLPDIATRADLTELGLYERPVTDADLEQIRGLTNLEKLSLQGTKLTDAGLVHLKNMKWLKLLDLSGCDVTGAGLEQLHGLPLESLILSVTRIRGAEGLARLKMFPVLQDVHLVGLGLRDNDLQPLTECQHLTHLLLNDNRLTDAGLKHLAKMKQLKRLVLQGGDGDPNRFTSSELNALREALPECEITPRP